MKFEISPSFVLRPADWADIRMGLNVIALNVPLNVLLLSASLLTNTTEEFPVFIKFLRL